MSRKTRIQKGHLLVGRVDNVGNHQSLGGPNYEGEGRQLAKRLSGYNDWSAESSYGIVLSDAVISPDQYAVPPNQDPSNVNRWKLLDSEPLLGYKS